MAAGECGKAEQARLEAYAFFEFGPEQRLRGLAPELFISVEGLFWYGERRPRRASRSSSRGSRRRRR